MDEHTAQPSVAIITLNWNNPDDTLACLRSVAALDYPAVSTFVVDNGSTDDSVARIRASFPEVPILETGANLGYAGGNNAGIRYALAHGADFTCILNNDVVVAPDFLEPLVTAAVEGSGRRVTMPMICEMRRPDVIWAMGSGMDWHTGSPVRLHVGELRSRWANRPPYAVDFAPGTAFLVSNEAWGTAGPIDEGYFLYFEEADWCVRAGRLGYAMIAVPAACVWHDVTGDQARHSPQITYYMTRNALRFLSRSLPPGRRWVPMLRVAFLAHWQVLGDLRRGQRERAKARLQGVYDFWAGRLGPMPTPGRPQ